jgi:hypothetical protein
VTVQNYDGTPAFFLGGTTTVRVINNNGVVIGTQTIDTSSGATFNNLNTAVPYSVEVYHASGTGLGFTEFWGSTSGVIVSPVSTTTILVTRSAPIFQSIQYNNSNPTVGQVVTVSVAVNNIDPMNSHRCSIRLLLDR